MHYIPFSFLFLQAQVFCIGNPVVWWGGTLAVFGYLGLLVIYLLRRRRAIFDLPEGERWMIIFLSWSIVKVFFFNFIAYMIWEVYKALTAEAHLYLKEQFTRVSTITSRTLRGSNLSLCPPRLKSRQSQNCFAYRGSSVWNSLSNEIKSSRTFESFQKKLKAMLAEKI